MSDTIAIVTPEIEAEYINLGKSAARIEIAECSIVGLDASLAAYDAGRGAKAAARAKLEAFFRELKTRMNFNTDHLIDSVRDLTR
jgi:hypothetical protein